MNAAKTLAWLALLGLLVVTSWASTHIGVIPALQALLAEPQSGTNPWFWATLLDAYLGFLWFWLWVAYKEPEIKSKLLWLALILMLGNMAMGLYVLLQLRRLPPGSSLEALLLRRPG